MAFGFRIESLTFDRPDAPVTVGTAQVVVIIGPNNSGKSQALRDIEATLSDHTPGLVVTALDDRREGTGDDLVAWLRPTTHVRTEGVHEMALTPTGGGVRLDQVAFLWGRTAPGLAQLTPVLVLRADADARLELAGTVASVNALTGMPIRPLQRLLKDHEAESRLSAAVRHAFDVGVSLNRAGGAELSLHLGSTTAEPRLDSPEYLAQLQALPPVESQGDGMRAFIGLLLTLVATDYPLVLVDEPEAFLHPPQARELAYQLAAPSSQQRFIATHSADVLLGLLDRAESLVVIRLRRSGDTSTAFVLEHERVQELWSDASFRYSNLFDGLFHTGVVVCEAEGDARLYAAALDDVRAANDEPTSDLLFTPCGGKHKFPTAVGALHPLGVPVSVVADIDLLRDGDLLRRVVASLGGEWENVSSDWQIVASAVTQLPVQAPVIRDVRNEIDHALGSDPTARVSEAQTRRIREITKTTDGWRLLKESGGVSAVPAGDATGAMERLLPALEEIGVFIVPVGTLEQWDRSIGKHGLAFVDTAFERAVHKNNAPLREFVKRIDTALTGGPDRA
jgi:hypothetical protein